MSDLLGNNLGYDGITHIGGGRTSKSDGTAHRVWIAFNPEQIKSATDNIGTFDKGNADIRYSRSHVNYADETDDGTRSMTSEEVRSEAIRAALGQFDRRERVLDRWGMDIQKAPHTECFLLFCI